MAKPCLSAGALLTPVRTADAAAFRCAFRNAAQKPNIANTKNPGRPPNDVKNSISISMARHEQMKVAASVVPGGPDPA